MNYRNYLSGLSVTTLIFGAILTFLTLFLEPGKGIGVIAFYFIALFFFVLGLTAILGFYFRKINSHNEIGFSNIRISIRQASLFALFVCLLLLLSASRLLNLWDGVILGISFLLIELYFKSRRYNEL